MKTVAELRKEQAEIRGLEMRLAQRKDMLAQQLSYVFGIENQGVLNSYIWVGKNHLTRKQARFGIVLPIYDVRKTSFTIMFTETGKVKNVQWDECFQDDRYNAKICKFNWDGVNEVMV